MNKEYKEIILGDRLSAAADFVRQGTVLCDVGTDHAFLPIYSVMSGRAASAIASDINEKPIEIAKRNVLKYGAFDRIKCIRTPGLDGLENYGISDVVICGMGGEMIAKIISSSGFIRRDGVRLIVQPMTMHDAARAEIANAGFYIVSESVVRENGKIYTVICADYDGVKHEYSDFEYLYGEFDKKKFSDPQLFFEYIDREASKLSKVARGRESAGLDASNELDLIGKLKEIRNSYKYENL